MSGTSMSTNYSQSSFTVTDTVDSVTEVRDDGKAVGRMWDSSDPFFTAQTRDLVTTVFLCYIRQVILCIGIPGNIVCCVVFWKQGLSDRINLLLFWLAVIDCFNLAIQLPLKIPCYFSDSILIHNFNVIRQVKISRIYLCSSFVSGNLIVVMSVERCLSVIVPFKARTLLTYRSMVAAIVLSYVIPFLGYFPFLLGDTVKWRVDPSTNHSIAYMAPTSWFPVGHLKTVITNYFNLIGLPLSFVIVVVCSTITVIYLRQTSLRRSQMTGKSIESGSAAADNRITVMLLILCIVYAVVLLSQISSSVIQLIVPDFFLYRKYHNSFVVYYHGIVFTSSCVNSTVNLYAYLTLSSRFRTTLKEVCSCVHVFH